MGEEMSEKFYRIDFRAFKDAIDNGGVRVSTLAVLLNRDVLVPVEPDYEAATAKLIEQGPSDFTDENVARNIIHAAFKGAGIGGSDG